MKTSALKLVQLVLLSLMASAAHAQLINSSVLTTEGTGAAVLTMGFTIPSGSSETVLLRNGGPGLTALGVSGAVTDPTISLYSGATLLASDNDWGDTNGAAIATATASVGAFSFANGSKDAAILTTLGAGSYTVQMSINSGSAGTGIGEIYFVSGTLSGSAKLSSVYVQSQISSSLTLGTIVSGATSNLLVRALGPALGISGTVTDPTLTLKNSSSTVVASNNDWGTAANSSFITGATTTLGLPALSLGSTDSALTYLASVGSYTSLVSTGSTGIVRLEVSDITAIPEPSTYAAFVGLGVLGVAVYRKRRRESHFRRTHPV